MELRELRDFMLGKLASAVNFWTERCLDREYGGILHCFDKDGKLFSTDKGVWLQGRAGWSFSYLYNYVKRDEKYLEIAKSSIDFAREHCIDTDGRMFVKVTRDGKPLEKSSDWFSETFYIIACAEYYLAAGDAFYLAEARKYYDVVMSIYRDPATDPYKVSATGTGSSRRLKTFARPMILLNVSSVLSRTDRERAETYDRNIAELAKDVAKFHSDEYHATMEAISSDGEIVLDSATCRVCNPGHDMECAWFMLEEGKRLGNAEMCRQAQVIFDDAYEMGYDRVYGGILYNRDILGAPVEAYEQDMKIWWVHNEAIIASLMLYLHTKDEKYKAILDDLVEYSFARFDGGDGEWYASLRRDGVPNETKIKGFIYKGPFHTLRMYAKCVQLLDGALKQEKI